MKAGEDQGVDLKVDPTDASFLRGHLLENLVKLCCRNGPPQRFMARPVFDPASQQARRTITPVHPLEDRRPEIRDILIFRQAGEQLVDERRLGFGIDIV